MMRLALRSPSTGRGVVYASEQEYNSGTRPGVRYVLKRMSAARRLELIERVMPLATEYEALRTSTSMEDLVRAEALRLRLDHEYLRWGLKQVTGLLIDGEVADGEMLLESGPEDLVREIVEAIRRGSELQDDERKN